MEIKWTDFLGKTWRFNDMGIAIINKKLTPPGGILYDGKYLVINQDPAVPIPGFIVITLKRHINSYNLLSKEEKIEISNLLYLIEKIEKELNISKEFTIVQEDRCPHFHIWIFPDENWLSNEFPRGIEKLREMFKISKERVTEETINETIEVTKRIKLKLNEFKVLYKEKIFTEII